MNDQKFYDKLIARREIDANGCWIWTGPWAKHRRYPGNRYGLTSIWDKTERKQISTTAHRGMWYALHGWPAEGMCVCHTCDVPRCFNPAHLFLADHKGNMADCKAKNRHFLSAKTHCKRGHSLSGDNLNVTKAGLRQCVACNRIRQRMSAGWTEEQAMTIPVVPHGYRPINGRFTRNRAVEAASPPPGDSK